MRDLNEKICIVSDKINFQKLLDRLNDISNKVDFPGSALVLNKEDQLVGIVTDGDIRRAIALGKGMGANVLEIANNNPIIIQNDENWNSIVFENKIKELNRNNKKIDFYSCS